MGTRALTFVYDEYNKPLINLYRQYDGYPTGHGLELAEFLGQASSNGMGCLAAQIVAHFKDSVGGFYIHSVDATECGQDYEYHVYTKDKELCVRITDRGCNMFGLTTSDINKGIFDGTVAEFTKYCTSKETA